MHKNPEEQGMRVNIAFLSYCPLTVVMLFCVWGLSWQRISGRLLIFLPRKCSNKIE